MSTSNLRVCFLCILGVGKTSLVHQICHSAPIDNPYWTIGCSVEVKVILLLAIIIIRFAMCSPTVKTMLFRTYCTSMYTAHIWCSYKKATMQKVTVAFKLF